MKNKIKKILKYFFITLLIIIVWLTIFASLQTASTNKDWIETDLRLPKATINWDKVLIKNVRNFKHITETKREKDYYDREYDLSKLDKVYYIVEPFSNFDWPAHTMLSFEFSDWKYVSFSAEIRKEKGESFSPFLWLLNQFELFYVWWDENDLVKLRANIRKDVVRMYPINTTKQKVKNLFISIIEKTNKLVKEPEFYNTFNNTCTTSILKHINTLRDEKISFLDLRILLPANSDKVAYEKWYIDTKLSLEQAREYYKINNLSEVYGDSKNYSKLIRVEKK